jgi:phosphoserine phosphatase
MTVNSCAKSLQLVVFDMDGTLTQVESTWQYLHESLGTWGIGRRSAEDYWSGLITYTEWARNDAKAWQGISLNKVRQLFASVPYTPGSNEAVSELVGHRIQVALVSAGIAFLADRTARQLGIQFATANELIHRDGRLTGEVKVNVSLTGKADIVRRIAEDNAIPLEACAAIGDTSYDLPSCVGLRIAFNPRDTKTAQLANVVIRDRNLRSVLQHIL